jgi:hypothetical protein
MLRVSENRVTLLVAEGRLFGWQTHPGKPACRMWLSERQVNRYVSDPDRVKRHERALRALSIRRGEAINGDIRHGRIKDGSIWRLIDRGDGRPPRKPKAEPTTEPTDRERWMEEIGLASGLTFVRRHNIDRDFGEFFTTKQAARELRVGEGRVHALRRRGRLTGHRRPPRGKKRIPGYWWFFRKEDVYRLLEDAEYLRNHERGVRGR